MKRFGGALTASCQMPYGFTLTVILEAENVIWLNGGKNFITLPREEWAPRTPDRFQMRHMAAEIDAARRACLSRFDAILEGEPEGGVQ